MRRFLDNKIKLVLMLANIFALAIIWFVASWRFSVSEAFIPIHYTIYFGFDRFGPRYDIFLFPTLSTLILFINLFVGRIVFKGNKLWEDIILGITLLLQMIMIVSLVLAILKGIS
jgi:hypothetical protein